MKLTGKAKAQFENWYYSLPNAMGLNYGTIELTMNRFYCLPKSMQWGIYQDWADSMGLSIEIYKHRWELNEWRYDADVFDSNFIQDSTHKTLQEARDAAIEKLNEIINEK